MLHSEKWTGRSIFGYIGGPFSTAKSGSGVTF